MGSNQWWTAVQVRNHRNLSPASEYAAEGGAWIEVPAPTTSLSCRASRDGAGSGYQFRVTDSYGNVLIDSAIPR